MENKAYWFALQTDFKEQTPKINIPYKKYSALYERAFLLREDKAASEFSQNTATWD